jgi:YegS/Rv2252/BmrU family lipid kinase
MMIFNPAAGWRDWREDLLKVVGYLSQQGWSVTWRETWGPGDATTFAREAVAKGYDVALAAGGDGTISEAVNGLAGTEVALGVLPIGTGNVWAREVGLPLWGIIRRDFLEEATSALVEARRCQVDVGRAGQQHFLLWAGVGLDAKVTEVIEPRTRVQKRWGALAYAVAVAAVTRDFEGTLATITIDGQVLQEQVILVLVSNVRLYGAMLRLMPQAQLDDGLFDVCIFKGHDWTSTLGHATAFLTGQYLNGPNVAYYRGRRVVVETAIPLPVQLDGDPTAVTPIELEIMPRALTMIVPRDIPEDLFVEKSVRSIQK